MPFWRYGDQKVRGLKVIERRGNMGEWIKEHPWMFAGAVIGSVIIFVIILAVCCMLATLFAGILVFLPIASG